MEVIGCEKEKPIGDDSGGVLRRHGTCYPLDAELTKMFFWWIGYFDYFRVQTYYGDSSGDESDTFAKSSYVLSRGELVPDAPALTDYTGNSFNRKLETDDTSFGPRSHSDSKLTIARDASISPDQDRTTDVIWFEPDVSSHEYTSALHDIESSNANLYADKDYSWKVAFAVDLNGVNTHGDITTPDHSKPHLHQLLYIRECA